MCVCDVCEMGCVSNVTCLMCVKYVCYILRCTVDM